MEPLVKEMSVSHEQLQISNLKENARRYHQLIQALATAIYICDKEGYIKFYNKAAIDLWGRTPEIGKDLWCGSWKIFTPDGVPMSFDDCPMAKALREGRPVRGEDILIERPDGVRLHVMPYPDPIFDSSGNIVEAVNVLVDITELKKKEEELRKNKLLLKQIVSRLEAQVDAGAADMNETNALTGLL